MTASPALTGTSKPGLAGAAMAVGTGRSSTISATSKPHASSPSPGTTISDTGCQTAPSCSTGSFETARPSAGRSAPKGE
ncbi:hypothetical protein WME81_50460 [Sorangium sp. So ce1078]